MYAVNNNLIRIDPPPDKFVIFTHLCLDFKQIQLLNINMYNNNIRINQISYKFIIFLYYCLCI